jgi:hypothetical protein
MHTSAHVHVDQYIQFDKQFYNVQQQFIGTDVWVRGTLKLVEIFDNNYTRIKTHIRTNKKRHTDPDDFPENFSIMMQDHHVLSLIDRAAKIGNDFKEFIVAVLTPHAKLNTRRAMALLRLSQKYSPQQLNGAATVALKHKLYVPKQFETVLQKMSSQDTEENILISEATHEFIRSSEYFSHK